jgi:MFS family permease
MSDLRSSRMPVYFLHLLVGVQYFLVIYINSSHLFKFTDPQGLSYLYIIGSVLSLIVFGFFSWLISRLGDFRLTLIISSVVVLSLLTLAFAQTALMAFIGFIVYVALSPVIFLNLDIFLERLMTDEAETGRVRGIFMSMKDIAQIGSPLLVSLLALGTDYTFVYIASAIALVAGLVLLIVKLSHFKDACYVPEPLLAGARAIFEDKGLRGAWISQLILYFFYGWMVIYVPLYLNEFIGFGWETLGIIFAIMLVPFLLLQYPLGKLSDVIGEKWILALGFLIMAASVAVIPFVSTASFIIWASILFMSRVGAAAVEIASESHFFRLTEASRADRMSMLRAVHPLMYIVASLSGAIALSFISFSSAFFVLAIVVLLGIPFALSLSKVTTLKS